jgi:hypothetical protein
MEYFEREVKPYVPDAWIDESYTDARDGRVGRVGYEINFNRYFYEYEPPRPLEEIKADIREIDHPRSGRIEKEIVQCGSDRGWRSLHSAGRHGTALLQRTAPEIAVAYERSRIAPGDLVVSMLGEVGV